MELYVIKTPVTINRMTHVDVYLHPAYRLIQLV